MYFLYVCQRKFLGYSNFKEQYGKYLPAQHAVFILDEAPQFCIYLETLWNCTNTKKYLNYSFNESFYLQYCAYFRLLYPFYGGSLFWLDKQISRVFVTSLWNLNRFLKAVLSLLKKITSLYITVSVKNNNTLYFFMCVEMFFTKMELTKNSVTLIVLVFRLCDVTRYLSFGSSRLLSSHARHKTRK